MKAQRTTTLLAAILLVSCGDDASPGAGSETHDVGATDVESAGDPGTVDAPDARTDVADDSEHESAGLTCPPSEGAFSAQCESDADCSEGPCLVSGDQGVCTQTCLGPCPTLCDGRDTFCRGLSREGGEVSFVCQPAAIDLCSPCSEDAHCEGGRCLTFSDGSSACGLQCSAGDCPVGFECAEAPESLAGQCVPVSGSCTCDEVSDGVTRPCSVANTAGVCAGQQTCRADTGWGACDADTPRAEICDGRDNDCDGAVDNGVEVGLACDVLGSPEGAACDGVEICQAEDDYACVGNPPTIDVCDGQDNDCDGVVDQDFVDGDGRYVGDEHCGSCGLACATRFFPFSEAVRCDGSGDEPSCVVTACQEGYQPAGARTCVPIQPNLCQPCEVDADCASSPGAICLTIVDASDSDNVSQVCGRDCSEAGAFDSECPDGYSCQTVSTDGEDAQQCAPTSGSCTCIGNPAGFRVPCTVTVTGEVDLAGTPGDVTCGGTRGCVENAFGSCELPEDTCDGFDNDCSGRIDDDFRDDAGDYARDDHCGRCFNDCTNRFANAVGSCGETNGRLGCVMTCFDDDDRGRFRDLRNGPDDGCECELTSAEDEPDLGDGCTGTACDQNCDGVDGDVTRALFVSKTGTAAADAGTREAPLSTIRAAVTRHLACLSGVAGDAHCPVGGARDIYVATGVYSENVLLDAADLPDGDAGFRLYGGYDLTFSERNPQANPTTLFGVRPAGDEVGTLTVRGVDRTSIVNGFSIHGFDATAPGESSYTVYLVDTDSAFSFTENRVFAGNGAPGTAGVPGEQGVGGGDGTAGGQGISAGTRDCSGTTVPGGAAGQNDVCGTHGGAGGTSHCPIAEDASGGECSVDSVDTCNNQCWLLPSGQPVSACGRIFCVGCTEFYPPAQGQGGVGQGNTGCTGDSCGDPGTVAYDLWSNDPACCVCSDQNAIDHIGGAGQPGRFGDDGTGGAGCQSRAGSVVGGRWRPATADPGTADAEHGGGGGGGSAGAGYDVVADSSDSVCGGSCADNLGGSGGGGGAGGCAGQVGGPGTGGGSSFSVFVHYSAGLGTVAPPLLDDNVFELGFGGPGGPGGSGGGGGLGGRGSEGGFSYPNLAFCTRQGGAGGNGGHGGAGAGGGGGCGGNSVGVFLSSNSNTIEGVDTWAIDNDIVEVDGGGQAGPGGASTGGADAQGQNGRAGRTFPREVR